VDIEKLKKAIYSGRVYQQPAFLTEDQVQTVLAEIADFEAKGRFQRKGLSNTVLGKNQTFSEQLDRSICVVPWFLKALEGRDTREIPTRIRQLQQTLSEALNRPTLADATLSHECYYSKSEVGSRLPRHMDERHEELKGAKGWLLPSRRSISWLIYLSDPRDWDLQVHGGALRSFPQRHVMESDSTHDENLQVGWLVSSSEEDRLSRPVYLDSWLPVVGIVAEGALAEPHCILYALDGWGEKEQLTRPWLTEALQGMPVWDFLKACAQNDSTLSEKQQPLLFVSPKVAQEFEPLEDRMAWEEGQDPPGSEVVDMVPLRGSLVVFDSVKLPHQVQLINNGTRLALAGWFHEKTQEFPESFYGSTM
jgi:hypothetical protein